MEWPALATFAQRPRDALMWVPRAIDIARIRAVLAVAGPRVIDFGAGTGLFARLLDMDIVALEPAPPRVRYHDLVGRAEGPFDAAIVGWMEAGHDYRAQVAGLAPVIINAYDIEGGCGVMGDVDFAPFGFREVATWRTPSFEDAAKAIETHGALKRRAYPGNRIDILSREPSLSAALRAAVDDAEPGAPLAWEREMDALRL